MSAGWVLCFFFPFGFRYGMGLLPRKSGIVYMYASMARGCQPACLHSGQRESRSGPRIPQHGPFQGVPHWTGIDAQLLMSAYTVGRPTTIGT